MQDRYAELLNLEMEVSNILETNKHELTDKEKIPVIKNWLNQVSMLHIKILEMMRKKNKKKQKDTFQSLITK